MLPRRSRSERIWPPRTPAPGTVSAAPGAGGMAASVLRSRPRRVTHSHARSAGAARRRCRRGRSKASTTASALLLDTVVEVIHRVRTDPARLSKRWFRGVIVAGFSEEQYVETVSIVAHGRRDRHDGARSGSRPAAAAAAGTRQAVAIPAPRRQAGRCLGPVAGAGGSDRTGGGDLPGRAADGEHHEGDEPGARRGEGLLRCRVAPIPGAIRNARFLA